MSRCYPYPPPGYLRNGARGEAVSETVKVAASQSIKFQRDLKDDKPLTDKHKKKDKKEKRSKKEKKKASSLATDNKLGKSLLKGKDDEEAERSSLTEEHGQPVSHHQSLSSDSTRSSNKRKSDYVVHSASNATKNNGNVIRIRLALQRHTEPNLSANVEHLCSTSGRTSLLPEKKQVVAISRQDHGSTIDSMAVDKANPVPFKSISDAGSEKKEKSSRHHISRTEKKLLKAEALYKTLFGDWTAPAIDYDQNNCDDQSWLSGTKTQDIHRDKRIKISHHDEPCHEASSFWPCARNLPQADIYALPYTVPF
ncbi:uncharacterized protein LOC126664786 [Mercurialis annua]|uniref:uncharacterized protein LOC126664786 n=1 Tax=Mercurialis annua TaxID=3986 RepID=UPI002160E636|nr:uncharacterized protein LOC126664786 [Mercurialis annua]